MYRAHTLVILIIFCLVLSDLVDARSRIGVPTSVTLEEREVDDLSVSSREEEQSRIDEPPSVNIDGREVDELLLSRIKRRSKYDHKGSDEDVERRSAYNQQEQRVYDLINAARKISRSCGSTWCPAVRELAWNDQLADAARRHAYDMRNQNYFSHTSMDGRTLSTRIRNAGYNFCAAGENIAGNSDADKTVSSWLSSAGHCTNIMSNSFRDIGIGYASGGPYGAYWVQNFGSAC